jgi:hypothetical protein
MCNVFSGLVVTKKGKDWGKVIFDSGAHHEKDRMKYAKEYGDELLAWESTEPYSLEDFKITHTLNVSKEESDLLLDCVRRWAKTQDKDKLLRSMITVLDSSGNPADYEVIDEIIKTGDRCNIACDFKTHVVQGNYCTATQGDDCTAIQGYRSTATQGDWSTAIQGDWSTATQEDKSTTTQGDKSTVIQRSYSTATQGDWSTAIQRSHCTATQGDWSTVTQGSYSTATQGDDSTVKQGDSSTCITYGNVTYVILHGKNVVLRQIYPNGDEMVSKIIFLDELLKKYEKGTKLKIVGGEVVEEVKDV